MDDLMSNFEEYVSSRVAQISNDLIRANTASNYWKDACEEARTKLRKCDVQLAHWKRIALEARTALSESRKQVRFLDKLRTEACRYADYWKNQCEKARTEAQILRDSESRLATVTMTALTERDKAQNLEYALKTTLDVVANSRDNALIKCGELDAVGKLETEILCDLLVGLDPFDRPEDEALRYFKSLLQAEMCARFNAK